MDIALVKVMLVWMDSDSNDSAGAMRTELSIWNGLVYDGGHGFHCG
jgi:hypothetical protein